MSTRRFVTALLPYSLLHQRSVTGPSDRLRASQAIYFVNVMSFYYLFVYELNDLIHNNHVNMLFTP